MQSFKYNHRINDFWAAERVTRQGDILDFSAMEYSADGGGLAYYFDIQGTTLPRHVKEAKSTPIFNVKLYSTITKMKTKVL